MIIGHIGARGGSKGVPGKNFRDMQGKPLIDWSLDQLFAAPQIDHVVVSSDDPAIYEHGVARGGLDIGPRPAHLATDGAGKFGVWQHALKEVEKLVGDVDVFVDLDCTSPLRLQEDIDGAMALYEAEKPDMVMSCAESRKNPYFNILELSDGRLNVSKPLPGGVLARQNAPKVYDHVGLVYVLRAGYLKEANTLFDGRVIPYEVPNERGLDVDSPFDWDVVEYLLGKQIEAGLKR